MTKVIDQLNKADKTLFSFELLPPLKQKDINIIYNAIDPLIEFNPAFINVTYHREEVMYKRHKSGLLEKRIVHKRPGTVAISAAIKYKYHRHGIVVVPHIICGGFTQEETEYALIDLHFLGIRNVLALRGDAVKSEKTFMSEPGGHTYAIDLVKQIVKLNNGIYLDEELGNTSSMDFCIGVAGYPEKHMESPNMDWELEILKKKIDAGGEYIVTQMFFDNQKYFDFVKRCRESGINVPIIPGIKPISTHTHLNVIPQTFHVDLPNELVKEVVKCKTTEAVRQVGVEWAIQQCKQLKEFGVPALHFYTMGKSDNIQKIASAVF